MKILVVGNGAREHSIIEALMRSPQKPELFSFMKAKNPAIAKMCSRFEIGNLEDKEAIVNFGKAVGADLAIIGSEAPLEVGVVDALENSSIPCFGPRKTQAQLECSKSFTRDLLEKYNIQGNLKFKTFSKTGGVIEFLEELGNDFVVKPDGLTGGKGVKVSDEHLHSHEEAVEYCKQIIDSGSNAIIEEKVEGEEFSLQCLTDGKTVVAMPAVQDHKRAFAGDTGSNTGGMGSYSCENHLLPFLTEREVKEGLEITKKVAEAIFKETGRLYKGVMYGGFIITKDGVKLLEYNARFGDPEAMNVLPLLKTDFLEICKAIVDGSLDKIKMEFEQKATVCKYIVPEGYPNNPVKDQKIIVDGMLDTDAKIYYASVNQKDDGLYMTSSRAIAVVGIADKIDDAEKIAQNALVRVKGPVHFREDIGTKGLLQKRVEHMKKIRG